MPDGTYEPRWKSIQDGRWVNGNSGTNAVDIANTPFASLPDYWQADNRAAADFVINEVMNNLYAGSGINEDRVQELAARVHDAWRHRPGWHDPILMVDYIELPQEEQLKDVVQVREAMEVVREFHSSVDRGVSGSTDGGRNTSSFRMVEESFTEVVSPSTPEVRGVDRNGAEVSQNLTTYLYELIEGRVVLEITFDQPIGEEAVTEIAEGQNVLRANRLSGGRQEAVQVVDGARPATNTLYVMGGSYGPTGRMGLYTVFSGEYAPPMNDTAYWNHHAFLTGDNVPSSWRQGEDGRVAILSGSRLEQMLQEGRASIPGVQEWDTFEAPSTPVFEIDAQSPAYRGYFGSEVRLSAEQYENLMSHIPEEAEHRNPVDNLHITLVDPREFASLVQQARANDSSLSKSAAVRQVRAQLFELKEQAELQPPRITGIGSATSAEGYTTYWATVEWPGEAQIIREMLGLPPKDFHITLASTAEENGQLRDIHDANKAVSNVVDFREGVSAPDYEIVPEDHVEDAISRAIDQIDDYERAQHRAGISSDVERNRIADAITSTVEFLPGENGVRLGNIVNQASRHARFFWDTVAEDDARAHASSEGRARPRTEEESRLDFVRRLAEGFRDVAEDARREAIRR